MREALITGSDLWQAFSKSSLVDLALRSQQMGLLLCVSRWGGKNRQQTSKQTGHNQKVTSAGL